jgi:YhcH/YjgK/YiaL family protein
MMLHPCIDVKIPVIQVICRLPVKILKQFLLQIPVAYIPGQHFEARVLFYTFGQLKISLTFTMIHDSLQHCALYAGLNPMFKKAFDYLKKTDLNTLAFGKHIIEGEDLFVIFQEYESKDPSACKMENHRKYIDIQYMFSGEELIGISTFNGQVPTEEYDETKEVAFYKNEYTSQLKLEQGQFAIFFPHDLHMPCIKAEKAQTVKKAVFKVRVI